MNTATNQGRVRALARRLAPLLLACSLGVTSSAQHGWVGKPAPELALDTWFNLPQGSTRAEPTKGRVCYVEFWGTSTKSCEKTLPHAQAFQDRFGDLGLQVLAVSYDTPAVIQAMIQARGLRIPIGSDTTMSSYSRFGVPEVPTACLIGKDGSFLYHGPPEAADLAIEQALGLELSPAALLDAYLAPAERGAAEERAELLARLVAKAPRSFDLAAWAKSKLERVPAEVPPLDSAGAALERYARATGESRMESRSDVLLALAVHGPRGFDLKQWSRSELARLRPLQQEELEELLASKRHDLVLEAVLHRAPSAELLQRAASDPGFVEHCAHVTLEARSSARKGLLVQYWIFPGVEPISRPRLWGDLGIAGPAPVEGGGGISIGFERVDAASIAAFVDESLLRHLACSAFASRRPPQLERLPALVAAERDRMLRDLVSRHGGVKLETP